MALLGGLGLFSLGALATWTGSKLWDNWTKNNKKKLKETEKERELRKKSALEFLGQDTSDDASDVEIPFSPVEVLDNITGGLLPGSTTVPDIDSSAIVAETFADIIKEIEKINRNIEAIHGAMLASAIIESNYRQEVIADLEQSIADRDKERSRQRAGRRRGNVKQRQPKPKKKRFGNVGESFKKMGIITGALFLSEFAAAARGGVEGVKKFLFGGDIPKGKGAEAGGIVSGPDSGYSVTLHGTELVIPLDNKVTDGIPNNEVTDNGSKVSNIFKNGGSSFALNNKSNIFSTNPSENTAYLSNNLSTLIQSNKSITIPVGDDQGSFTVIDMRTAKKLVNPNDGKASVTGGTDVITRSPERRPSPYEPFVTHHA